MLAARLDKFSQVSSEHASPINTSPFLVHHGLFDEKIREKNRFSHRPDYTSPKITKLNEAASIGAGVNAPSITYEVWRNAVRRRCRGR